MSEEEYIKVTNKTALRCAMDCLQQVLSGDAYGVKKDVYLRAMGDVGDMLDHVFKELDGAITESNEGGK